MASTSAVSGQGDRSDRKIFGELLSANHLKTITPENAFFERATSRGEFLAEELDGIIRSRS